MQLKTLQCHLHFPTISYRAKELIALNTRNS